MKECAIYIHIPFCVKKCDYCDFLSAPATEQVKREYVTALCGEIRREAPVAVDYQVSSVFFGGGTPSVLDADWLAEVLRTIKENYQVKENAEITVECNPGTLSSDKLAVYRAAGVNRLSIGLQSADNRELRLLGRIHTWEQFLESFSLARAAGFDNINIDLMSALPGQTEESYERTLRRVIALQPEHISAYSLIIEEGTPFYERYAGQEEERSRTGSVRQEKSDRAMDALEQVTSAAGQNLTGGAKNQDRLPDEDTERRMYERTEEVLGAAGYVRYEISNYAKPGRECRHNLCYWERTPYLGFGLGAASLFEECRFARERELPVYKKKLSKGQSTRIEEEYLDKQTQMEEYMFLGLRKIQGVSMRQFEKQYGSTMMEIYGKVIEKYLALGMLQINGDMLSLTPEGINVSNVIFSEFLL